MERPDLEATQKWIDELYERDIVPIDVMLQVTNVIDEARKLERITKRLEEVEEIAQSHEDAAIVDAHATDGGAYVIARAERRLAQELLKELK